MRTNEVKETREVVVRTEYIAEDGKVFTDREECQKYDNTCQCVIMTAYKPLVKGTISEYELYNDCGCEEFYYDIVDIKDENDREIVNKALKFAYSNARIVEQSEIGTTILVAKEYDESLTGYHTSLNDIFERIKSSYEKALIREENANA